MPCPSSSQYACPEKGWMLPAPVLQHFGELQLTEGLWGSGLLFVLVAKPANNSNDAEDTHGAGAQQRRRGRSSSKSWCNEVLIAGHESHRAKESI